MSSDGDDDPPSPSAFLEAPSSQSLILDAKQTATQINLDGANADRSDQDSFEDERENRFLGPASTWRDFTVDERTLATSLDQERANDLSVHLYNAHALKARLYDKQAAANSRQWKNKQHWIRRHEDGSTPWHPDSLWTAWPLRAEDVPRQSESFGKDVLDDAAEASIRIKAPWRPAADLEGELQALMLRGAKDRFRARRFATAEQPPRPPARSRSTSQIPSSPPTGAASRQSSVASDMHSHVSDADNVGDTTWGFCKPKIMVDEDEATRLLRPSVRHVLSKFDEVLMGLHESRRYQVPSSRSTVEPATKRQTQKRKRRSTTDETTATLATAKLGAHVSQGCDAKTDNNDGTKHSRGGHAIHPRDWSEVLGVASMLGWNPAVIDRAAKRCAALFGEHMALKVMPETAAGSPADRIAQYNPEMVPDLNLSVEEDVQIEGESRSSDEVGLTCPEDSCPQHHRVYEKRWLIRQHLRRAHKYDQSALDAYDRARPPPTAQTSVDKGKARDSNIGNEDGIESEDHEERAPSAAVDTDGYMESLSINLGRGRDVQDRKKRVKQEG